MPVTDLKISRKGIARTVPAKEGPVRILRSYRFAALRIMATAGIVALALAWGASDSRAAAQSLAGPSPAQLQKALIGVVNLPDIGFQEETLPSGSSVDTFAPCPYAANGPQPVEEADAGFTAGPSALDAITVVEALQQYPVNSAEEQLSQFAAIAASACRDFTVDLEGLKVHVTLAHEAFPSYGNRTVALRLNATIINAGNLTFDSDLVAVRHGGTVIVITNTAQTQSFNATITRIAVSAAYKKVAALP
jgi:hypothetical protein